MSSSVLKGARAEAAWVAACRLGTFTYASLSAAAHMPVRAIAKTVQSWSQAGAVVSVGPGMGRFLTFSVVQADPPPAPPPKPAAGTVTGNLWRTMRFLGAFSPTDLRVHAHTDDVRVGRDEATAYCQMLHRAGYLRVVQKAIPGRREAVYRLVRNTGPKAPELRRIRAVVDPNLGEIVHVAKLVQS